MLTIIVGSFEDDPDTEMYWTGKGWSSDRSEARRFINIKAACATRAKLESETPGLEVTVEYE